MNEKCNPDLLEVRKRERNQIPISSCVECVFNVLCADYNLYEESNQQKENSESKKDCMKG